MGFLQRIIDFFTWWIHGLVSLILPFFGPDRLYSLGRFLWIVLHIAVVIGITVGLYFLNVWMEWFIDIPKAPWLAKSWLSILWLLFYALAWLGYFLWKLIVADETEIIYPDILEAWQNGLAALLKEGYNVRDLPMFLVLGQSLDGDDTLFQASGISLKIRNAPRADAPIHIHANDDAIYVTCPRASSLSAQAGWLNSDSGPEANSGYARNSDDEKTNFATNDPNETGGTVAEIRDIVVRAKSDGRSFSPVERREIRRLHRSAGVGSARRNAREIDEQTLRLRYLCRLIVKDRRPFCGVNGMLVLLPFAGTDSSQDATDTGETCHRDLEMAQRALGQHCPVIAVVCDMETAPGFKAFAEQFNDKDRRKRMGQRCPMIPNLISARHERAGSESEAVRTLLRSMAHWLCKGFLRQWIYKKCRLEKGSGDSSTLALETNSELFELLYEMQQRKDQLAIILEKGFSQYAPPDRLLFGGCYVAGTGRRDDLASRHLDDEDHRSGSCNQAFMTGVMERLFEGVDCVYWTDDLKAEEARLIGWINLGWTVLAVLILLCLAGLGYHYMNPNQS